MALHSVGENYSMGNNPNISFLYFTYGYNSKYFSDLSFLNEIICNGGEEGLFLCKKKWEYAYI